MTDSNDAADDGEPITETREEPTAGSVIQTEWIDDGTLVAHVEDEDGDLWIETYEFTSSEKAIGY